VLQQFEVVDEHRLIHHFVFGVVCCTLSKVAVVEKKTGSIFTFSYLAIVLFRLYTVSLLFHNSLYYHVHGSHLVILCDMWLTLLHEFFTELLHPDCAHWLLLCEKFRRWLLVLSTDCY